MSSQVKSRLPEFRSAVDRLPFGCLLFMSCLIMYRLDLTSFIHNTPKSAPSTVCLQLSTGPVVVRPAGRQMNVNVNIHNTLTRKQKVTPAQDDLIRKWYFYVYRSLPVGRGAVDSGPAAVLAAVESVAVSAVARSCGCVVGSGWFVVRFVRVIRVPACARVSRVSRVCPGSPRCQPVLQ